MSIFELLEDYDRDEFIPQTVFELHGDHTLQHVTLVYTSADREESHQVVVEFHSNHYIESKKAIEKFVDYALKYVPGEDLALSKLTLDADYTKGAVPFAMEQFGALTVPDGLVFELSFVALSSTQMSNLGKLPSCTLVFDRCSINKVDFPFLFSSEEKTKKKVVFKGMETIPDLDVLMDALNCQHVLAILFKDMFKNTLLENNNKIQELLATSPTGIPVRFTNDHTVSELVQTEFVVDGQFAMEDTVELNPINPPLPLIGSFDGVDVYKVHENTFQYVSLGVSFESSNQKLDGSHCKFCVDSCRGGKIGCRKHTGSLFGHAG